MKIALLAHNKFPIAQPYAGGLEMITHLLAKNLQQRGHQVDLFALKGSDPEINLIPLDHNFVNWQTLKEKQNSEHIGKDFIDTLMYSLALSKISETEYDIVHNHSMHHLPLIWGETTGKEMISTFHTPVFEDIHRGLTSIHKTRKQRFTTVSASLGQTYADHITDYNVVYNGIETKNWTFHRVPNPSQVCWIGRICKEKAPHKAIEFALRAQKKIVLAGPISEREYFEEYFKPLLNNDHVEYAGHLKQRELNKIIGESSATLFTSVWEEPYGLVIAESLASGTPVIAWELGAAPEIITSACGIVVPAFQDELFVDAIKRATDINRHSCRERALSFCNVSTMVNAYECLYEEMIIRSTEAKLQTTC